MKYKRVYQRNTKDCGVACLLSIIRYYKGNNTFENIRYLTKCNNNGITALNLVEASKKLGFESRGLKCEYEDLYKLQKPLICHTIIKKVYNHYIVLYKVNSKYAIVFDPYYGIKKYSKSEFMSIWDNIVIELKPLRKLDFIKEDYLYYFKKIILCNKKLYFIIIVISFISIILTIISNYYFKLLLESNNLLYVFIFFIFIVMFKEINNLIRYNSLIKLETRILKMLNLETHKKLLSLPYYYFNSRTSGDIITKFNDLEHIKNFLVQAPTFIFVDITLLLFTSLILYNINLTLFLYFIISCILYLLILIISNNKIRKMIESNQEHNSYKNTILYENINCINTIKNMDIKELRHNVFSNANNEFIKNSQKYEKYYIKTNISKNLIIFIGINLILYIGMKLVRQNIMSISDLILFNSLIIFFVESLSEICELSPIIKNGINAMKRVGEIYSIDTSNKNIQIPSTYNIKFNNLSFSYDGYNDVLTNINYDIKFKDKLMVIGESGCGKSTLFKLLSKIHETKDNEILIDNKSINNIDISNIITYVSEEEKLFNDTILNNIILNNNTKLLEKVLSITGVKEILNKKNLSLNSIIEESGTNFSKGEKQKIILSRSLLKNSKILILDEPLSGVEENDEYKIMKKILYEFKDITIIYISHSKVCLNMFNKVLNFNE